MVRLKGAKFRSYVFETHPHTGCFTACMDAHFHIVELDTAIQFMQFRLFWGFQGSCGLVPNGIDRILQNTPGTELLACNVNTDFNSVITLTVSLTNFEI